MIPDYNCNCVYFSAWLKTDYPEIYSGLVDILKSHDIVYDIIPETKDVWCRNYMPLQTSDESFFCYKFYPDYLSKHKSYNKYITDNTDVCKLMKLKTVFSDIVIDGGNVVKVGDKIIMTEKVFAENPDIKKGILKNKLKKLTGCEIVFIPWDKKEHFGHADGIVKPISENAVLMTNYNDYDITYYDKCRKILSEHFKVESLHYDVEHKDYRNWAYINFLTVGHLLVVPKLNIKEDIQALEQLLQYYPDYTIEQLDIEKLVSKGGGLNCVTWCRKINDEHSRFLELFNRFESEKDLDMASSGEFTNEEICFMCKYDLVKFSDKYPGVGEYYMKCLCD